MDDNNTKKNSPESNQKNARDEKKAELRRRLKAMEEARRGKTIISDSKENITKKERRKMKKVVKSSHVDELLKQFNISDEATKTCLRKAIQDGRISNMEDLAKFLSNQTNSNVTANDLMQNNSSETTMEQSNREAEELLNILSPKTNVPKNPTGYEDVELPQEKRRPGMSAPFTVSKEDLE